ncbi:lyase family protein [Roseovarius aquimarinus]|uniref:Lyase family protein n=1 Tax=Roseovarius aquimarinus TaxID=1229156 RepID=A0ABW7I606_9RHOB
MMLMDGLFSDDALAEAIGPEAQLAAMRTALAALAIAQARLGIIPKEAAKIIQDAAGRPAPAPEDLRDQIAQAGIPAQAVIKHLKAEAGAQGDWAGFGATSQDIQDTGLSLQLRGALSLIETRLAALGETLDGARRQHGAQIMPARTRSQIAAPTTLGARIAVWRAPLARHLERLAELRPRVLCVSLYGAAGTGAALAPRMTELRAALATDLALCAPETPWHAARDGIAELGGWLSLVTGSLGKMGADLVLMARDGEVMAGRGGGSSTMPQKSNPVAAEALVSLAHLNAGALGTLHQALVHADERDGAALGIEWQILPEMILRTGAALRLAEDLARSITPHPARIAAVIAADGGRMMAEAAVFHLCRSMPRGEAEAVVARALAAMGETETLAGALEESAPGHDWARILAPDRNTGQG